MIFLLFNFLFVSSVQASEIPTTPPNPCYENCTDFMTELVQEFEDVGVVPDFTLAVYSGDCHHLGQYNSDHTHYAVVFIDQLAKPNFSTIFAFFAEENEFAGWTPETARAEMSPYWKEHGDMIIADKTARVEVLYDDGAPAYVYWMRQNPQTQQLLYITYAGPGMKSFCRLNKNGGLRRN